MLDFLPNTIKDALQNLNIQYVYELRLRANKPTRIYYYDDWAYLGMYGIAHRKENAIYCDINDIADCVFRAGKCSVYAIEEQIKRGFITAENGERVGLAGEFVFDKGEPLTIRNITGLCVRVPHEKIGCSTEVYQRCMSDKLYSTLICSPPGLGKTTILRDVARKICEKTRYNVLICDERGEIGVGEVGDSADLLRFGDKNTTLEVGIRAMRPDVIITDELSVADCASLERAVNAGIIIIASAHYAKFSYIHADFLRIFERFVILNSHNIGAVDGIYNREGMGLI